jgi:hypothetical protein
MLTYRRWEPSLPQADLITRTKELLADEALPVAEVFVTPVARIARDVRPFRIYDGRSKVHRWFIARRAPRGTQRVEGMPG